MGLNYILKTTPVGTNPFDPENTLVFTVTAENGAPVLDQSRVTVVANSPLTNAVGDRQADSLV